MYILIGATNLHAYRTFHDSFFFNYYLLYYCCYLSNIDMSNYEIWVFSCFEI